jgi:hypothetical protein
MSDGDDRPATQLATIQVVRLIRQCRLPANERHVLESFVVFGAGVTRIAPRIESVAYDAEVSVRTAQRLKARLVAAKILRVVANAHGGLAPGGLRGKTPVYTLNLKKLPAPRPPKGDSHVSPFNPIMTIVRTPRRVTNQRSKGDKNGTKGCQKGGRRVTAMVSPDLRDLNDLKDRRAARGGHPRLNGDTRNGRVPAEPGKYAQRLRKGRST